MILLKIFSNIIILLCYYIYIIQTNYSYEYKYFFLGIICGFYISLINNNIVYFMSYLQSNI